jgi:16S rRNA (cytosine967-C5)-methyltransferase
MPVRGRADQGPASRSARGRAGGARPARAGGSPGPSQGIRARGGRADPPRRVAFEVLNAVQERDAYANLLLPALLRDHGLTGRDAALATELAYGALRGQGTYDAILAICCDRDLGRIDPPVRQVLRLGAHQLLATRIGAHAAVATSVDLAKDVAGQRPAGFVNAVLRRVATRDLESWLEIAAPSRDDDLAGHLAVRYSHPRWIVGALAEALGESAVTGLVETEAALAADGERPQVTLCAVPGLAGREELVAGGATPARWSAFGAYLAQGDPAQVTAVAQGRAAVQDEASQLAAIALARADAAGARGAWLDLCAGPGGKARLLAGLAAQGGSGGKGGVGGGGRVRLLGADVRLHRAKLLRTAVAGIPAAAVITADGTAPAWRPGAFDRVLADVPCSGLGALRRRAEARWRRSPEDITELGPLQRRLLAAALDSAAPGGVVAYVTCSPHLAETRDVVTDVLAGRDDVEVLDAPAVLPEVPGLRCPEPHGAFAQFWPHRHGTDAIFLALLRRRAS